LAEKLHIEDEARVFVNGAMTSLDSKYKMDPNCRPLPAKAKFDKTKLQPTKNGVKPKESATPVSTENRGYKNAESPSGNSEVSANGFYVNYLLLFLGKCGQRYVFQNSSQYACF
jgi:hypothetical protein